MQIEECGCLDALSSFNEFLFIKSREMDINEQD